MKFTLEQATEILSATPPALDALLGSLSPAWIESETGDEGWNPFDVVGHLIHGEETDWIPRARIILAPGPRRVFEPFDRFAQMEKPNDRPLAELLAEFAARRRENLETLRSWNLTADQLELTGRHPELGEVTLAQLLATWAAHDLTHIRQIAVHLAKKYAAEVGPWRAYLSILQ